LKDSEIDCVLHVPFNVLRQFGELHPRVTVIRKVMEMSTHLLPKLPEAKELNLYFNASFDADKAIIAGLTQSSFVFRTGECYLDLQWMESQIRKVRNVQSKL
jgi:hypothetical protein